MSAGFSRDRLGASQWPDASRHCAGSDVPNIITTLGDDIRVAHPNPEVYGYTQIYVSRSNPDPTMVEQITYSVCRTRDPLNK